MDKKLTSALVSLFSWMKSKNNKSVPVSFITYQINHPLSKEMSVDYRHMVQKNHIEKTKNKSRDKYLAKMRVLNNIVSQSDQIVARALIPPRVIRSQAIFEVARQPIRIDLENNIVPQSNQIVVRPLNPPRVIGSRAIFEVARQPIRIDLEDDSFVPSSLNMVTNEMKRIDMLLDPGLGQSLILSLYDLFQLRSGDKCEMPHKFRFITTFFSHFTDTHLDSKLLSEYEIMTKEDCSRHLQYNFWIKTEDIKRCCCSQIIENCVYIRHKQNRNILRIGGVCLDKIKNKKW